MSKIRKIKRTIEQAPARKFMEIGDEIVGKLAGIRTVVVDGDERTVYDMIDDETDERFIVWSAAVMEQLINEDMIGEIVGIKWTGESPSKKKNQNPTRHFEINIYE